MNGLLVTVLLLESRLRNSRITAVVVGGEQKPTAAPEVGNDGFTGLSVEAAIKEVSRRGSIQIDVNWTAIDGVVKPADVVGRNLQWESTTLPGVLDGIFREFRDAHMNDAKARVCIVLVENPRRMLISTQEDILRRLGTTMTYRVRNLAEGPGGLSSRRTRDGRCNSLYYVVRGNVEDQLREQYWANAYGPFEGHAGEDMVTIQTFRFSQE